jgi:hypothetical protein
LVVVVQGQSSATGGAAAIERLEARKLTLILALAVADLMAAMAATFRARKPLV